MTAWDLREHAGYLGDTVRVEAFRRALEQSLRGGDKSVLDLGAGCGILGLLAAESGARVVYAVDSGPIIGPAAEVAASSEYGDRFVHIHGVSTEIELPERVDVAVCDQIGGFVHDGGVLRVFADARRRLLADDGTLVPAAFRLYFAPAECDKVREQIGLWGSSPHGFDFDVFRTLAVNTEHYVFEDEIRLLGPGIRLAEIRSDHVEPIVGEERAEIVHTGRCDGVVGWFEADLGHGVVLTNKPGDRARMRRWCNFFPIEDGPQVLGGEAVQLTVDVRPLLNAVTWSIAIEDQRGETFTRERHSSLLGAFVSPDELSRARGTPIAATRLGRLVGHALGLADGTRTEAEIIDDLRRAFDADLESTAIQKTVRETLRRFSLPRAPASSADGTATGK